MSELSEKFALKNAGGLASPLHPLALCVGKVSVRGHGISIIHSGRFTALHGLLFANLTSYAGQASFTAVGFADLFRSFPCASLGEYPSIRSRRSPHFKFRFVPLQCALSESSEKFALFPRRLSLVPRSSFSGWNRRRERAWGYAPQPRSRSKTCTTRKLLTAISRMLWDHRRYGGTVVGFFPDLSCRPM